MNVQLKSQETVKHLPSMHGLHLHTEMLILDGAHIAQVTLT